MQTLLQNYTHIYKQTMAWFFYLTF